VDWIEEAVAAGHWWGLVNWAMKPWVSWKFLTMKIQYNF
jgi:hypothetical protein